MMTSRRLSLTAIFYVCLIAMTEASAQQCCTVHSAHLKSIFALAPAPAGNDVLFFGSAEKAEGELITGNLFRLRLSGESGKVIQLKTPEASNPAVPVWKPDGNSAYFETDQGIYQLSSTRESPKLFLKGLYEGLAISSDGLFLAFWRIEKNTETLVVYDIKKRSEVRTWKISDLFESDKSGWDLAFSSDVRALYARTYDEASTTPLKKFDINSGEVMLIDSDCYSVAAAQTDVYFIAVSGTLRSLHKISLTTDHSGLAAKEFAYDSLSRSGNPRWLVSQDYRTGAVAIVDTETDTIKSIGKPELASVLSDGRLLIVRGGEIKIGPSLKSQ